MYQNLRCFTHSEFETCACLRSVIGDLWLCLWDIQHVIFAEIQRYDGAELNCLNCAVYRRLKSKGPKAKPLTHACITVLLLNSKFCDLGSLTFGNNSTFVYGPLFRGIRPIGVYSPKQGSTYKNITLLKRQRTQVKHWR